MDKLRNPYAPGAGTPPPELAGRQELLDAAKLAIERVRIGRPAKGLLLVGLRGVGKTVLLDRMKGESDRLGNLSIWIEAPENRSLPALLAPQLRVALLQLSRSKRAQDLAERALRGLAGFAKALKVKYQDIELGLDIGSEEGLADNGDLESDLPDLLEAVGQATRKAEKSLVLFFDELQYVPEEQLAALVMAIHRVTQRQLPVLLVGAGLPLLRGNLGKAKSYAERLFEFPEVGPLTFSAASDAIRKPALQEGVAFNDDAIEYIYEQTEGYPYFIQEWGKHTWDVASASPIPREAAQEATALTIASLDASFFRVRFDRLTPSERRYLRAMAELGTGPHRSGEIAKVLSRTVSSLGPTRATLIAKGMIWSPGHGDAAFTVPKFDQFMRRVMPLEDWKTT